MIKHLICLILSLFILSCGKSNTTANANGFPTVSVKCGNQSCIK